MLQGFILFIAIVYSLINLVVDVSYGVIDPRVRVRDDGTETLTRDGHHEHHAPAGRRAARDPGSPRRRSTASASGAARSGGLRRNPTAIAGAIIVAIFVARRRLRAPAHAVRARLRGVVGPGDARPACRGRPADHWLGLDRFGSRHVDADGLRRPRSPWCIGVVSTAIGLIVGATWASGRRLRSPGGRSAAGSTRSSCASSTSCCRSRACCSRSASPRCSARTPISIMIAIGAAQVPIFARLLRGSMLAQGAPTTCWRPRARPAQARIVMSHVLPNGVGPIDRAGHAHRSRPRSSRSPPCPTSASARPTRPSPSGAACSSRPRTDSTSRPRLAILPGVCIAITALGFTLFGEALREALDPRTRR